MTARASNHSVVAEQWVCAWLRPHTVRVPSRSLGKIPKDCPWWPPGPNTSLPHTANRQPCHR
jgi:hypothetical protein